jgi:hypothetical protein
MTRWLCVPVILLAVLSGRLAAEEYRVEAFKDVPVPEQLSPDITAQLSPAGFKVMQGEKRTLLEIWPAKQWDVNAQFAPSATVLYPLKPGSLVGALRFGRKGADFRGQEIPSGVYTLRYGNQPVDGNHVGTFDTRDFLLMLPAEADTSPALIAEMDLHKTSAQSAESTHPAIMPLLKADGGGELPAMRHLAEQEWWTVRFAGQGGGGKKIVLELIVVGKAAE